MTQRSIALLAVLIASLIVPQRALAAWPADPTVNVPVMTGLGSQISVVAASDGAGGMIVAWLDNRAGNLDVYARRVTASGSVLWAASGTPVCTAAGDQTDPAIVSDGAGGAILTWVDRRSGNYEIYAQRMNALGQAQWTADGVLLSTGGTNFKLIPALVPSGTGAAIVAWLDLQSGHRGVYAQRVDAAGVPQWLANGVALCAIAGSYTDMRLAIDGKGGAIVASQIVTLPSLATVLALQRIAANGVTRWTSGGLTLVTGGATPRLCEDTRSGAFVSWQVDVNPDLWAQRVDSTGAFQWGASGLAVVAETGSQQDASLQPDGADGVYMVWRDDRGGIYGQRLDGSGNKLWNVHGQLLSTSAVATATTPQLVGDGTSGGRFAWSEIRTSSFDVFAQRFDASGTAQWGPSGVAVSTAYADQRSPALVADGVAGTLVTFLDSRDGTSHVYAQRLDGYGFPGDSAPTIVSVRDVANDQGGHVRVSWLPSPLDGPWSDQVESYRVLRRTAPGVYTEVGAQPSLGLDGYSMVVATPADSTGAGDGTTAFVVRARYLSDITKTWDSAPDSGHSVDNLPPNTPAQVEARYDGGVVRLDWQANAEPDVVAYRIYRGPSADFTPGPDSRVGETSALEFEDPAPNAYAYKLVAVDAHGNASPPAVVVPAGAALAGAWPASVSFAAPRPNPARGSAALEFALPHAAAVRLALYDVGGRRLRSLDAGTFAAGAHALTVSLVDDRGAALASGVYLVRLETAGATLVRRLAVVR